MFTLGSEGKLTLQEQKISVLTAVGNLSHNTVSGSATLQELSGQVTEQFIPLLSTEGTLANHAVTRGLVAKLL